VPLIKIFKKGCFGAESNIVEGERKAGVMRLKKFYGLRVKASEGVEV